MGIIKFILELIKLLTEETGKLWKAALFLLKLGFSIAFASWLFTSLNGPYSLIDQTNTNEVVHFFTNGLVFLPVFYFFLSYVSLFQLLPLLTAVFFSVVGSAIDKDVKIEKAEGRLLTWVLRKLKMLNITHKGRRIQLLENADSLYEMAMVVCKNEGKSALSQLKKTVIESIGNTYFVFLLAYFTIIPSSYHSTMINTLVIGAGVLIIIAYYGLAGLLDLLAKSSPTLVKIITEARLNEQMADMIKEHGIMLYKAPDNARYYDWQFRHEARDVAVRYVPLAHICRGSVILELIEKAKRDDKFLLLVSRNGITSDALALANQHSDHIQYIQITGKDDLSVKLKEVLDSRFALLY